MLCPIKGIHALGKCMTLGDLFAEHFWIVLAFLVGGLVLFIAFPVAAVVLVLTAVAVGLIMHNSGRQS